MTNSLLRAAIVCLTIACATLPSTTTLYAQSDCSQALERAEQSYSVADFDDVMARLKPCLEGRIAGDEEWQAYRLLALAYLFSDRIQEAEGAVDKMLAVNPRYIESATRDPIELQRMLQKYSFYPTFGIGVRAGLALSGRSMSGATSIAAHDDVASEKTLAIGSDIAMLMSYQLSEPISVTLEAATSSRAYGYTAQVREGHAVQYGERLSYITIPATIRWTIGDGALRPYIALGYFYQSLLYATYTVTSSFVDTSVVVSNIGLLSTADHRAPSNNGPIANIGLSYLAGDGYLFLEARYEHGLSPVVNERERFADQDLLYRHYYTDNDFLLRNTVIAIGYVYRFDYTAHR